MIKITKKKQIYRCKICGNIVEVLHEGVGELICCGQPMELINEKDEDSGLEKHKPVIEKNDGVIKVTVGSVPHPMEKDHYIEWIELIADGKVYRKELKPGDKPEAIFNINANEVTVRSYCNLHGLWKSDLN